MKTKYRNNIFLAVKPEYEYLDITRAIPGLGFVKWDYWKFVNSQKACWNYKDLGFDIFVEIPVGDIKDYD